MSFYSELKRRNVLRMAAAYIVSSWLLIQVAETVFPLFGFDDMPARIVVIVLAIGFIPALVISWAFELTPDGWRKEGEVDHSATIAVRTARRTDRIIMVVLAIGLAYFAVDKFVLSYTPQDAYARTIETLENNISIAVLPFEDRSPDKDQEYFADGIAEAVHNQLARLDGLNITGLRSSFRFKDDQDDLRNIGEQLGVDFLLTGTVNKTVESLKVSAQLIDARTGFLLGTPNTHDRPIDDVFDIQKEIAESVAGALSISLDIDGRNQLPGAGTAVIDAYDAYLEARFLTRRGRDFDLIPGLYEKALRIDPNYAEAKLGIGQWYGINSWALPPQEALKSQKHGRSLIEEALDMNPDLVEGYISLSAYEATTSRNWVGATKIYEKYKEKAPHDVIGQLGNSRIFARTGRLREAVRIDELRRAQDPLSYFAASNLAERYIQVGRYSDAAEVLDFSDRNLNPPPDQGTLMRRFFLALALDEPEHVRKALADYAELEKLESHPEIDDVIKPMLEEFDSARDNKLAALERLFREERLNGEGRVILASLAAWYDNPELAFDVMSEELAINQLRLNRIWYPHFSKMRSLEGFKNLARSAGLVEYWREIAWADNCEPTSADDFYCS